MELKKIINAHIGVSLSHVALRLLNQAQDVSDMEYHGAAPKSNEALDNFIEKSIDAFKEALIDEVKAIEPLAFQVNPSEEKIWEVQGQALVELAEEDPAYWVVGILLGPGKAEYVEHHGRKFVKK